MKLISIAVVTLAAASAFAAKTSNEYYFQPAGGQQAVEATYNTDNNPSKTTKGGKDSDNKSVTSDLTVDYAYGLNETMAVGANTFFGSDKQTIPGTSGSGNGLGDVDFYFKSGFGDMWHYGVDLGYNLGGKAKLNSDGIQTNRSSGGMSLKGNIGALMASGVWNYGADLSYTYLADRKVDDQALAASMTDVTLSGGNTLRLAPFGEYNYGMGFVGAELSYNMVGDVTTSVPTIADTTAPGESYLALKFYGSYDIADAWTGLAGLTYAMHTDHNAASPDNGSKVDAYPETDLYVGARYTF